MKQIEIKVTNPHGLHARPANLFARQAQTYDSEITILFGGGSYNAKSIISVLSACVVKDSVITLVADGADEDAALDGLTQAIEAGLGE